MFAFVVNSVLSDYGSIYESKSPEARGDDFGPMMLSVEKHGASNVTEVTDMPFSEAVLMMCISAREGNTLVGGFAGCTEIIIGENTIIAVITFDCNIGGGRKTFEFGFGGEDAVSVVSFMEIDVWETTEYINKDSGVVEAFISRFPMELWNETRDRGRGESVNVDKITGASCRELFGFMLVGSAFSPGLVTLFPILTSWAKGDSFDRCKAFVKEA